MTKKQGLGRNKLLALFRDIEELLEDARKNRGIWDWVDTGLDLQRIKKKWMSYLKESDIEL